MISSRAGETLTVKSDNGNVIVLLTDSTTKDDTGLFGLRTDEMASVVLIPGLKVDVDGASNEQGQFVAKTITVDGDDLETSEIIQAGINPTAKQVESSIEAIDVNRRTIEANRQSSSSNATQIEALKAGLAEHKQNSLVHEQKIVEAIKAIRENTNRFMSLADYDVKTEASVKFGFGSSSLSEESEDALETLAKATSGLKGYIIQVTGRADSTGDDAVNTKLSEDRARAVIICLMRRGEVPVRHIVARGAMGEYAPVVSNETAAGRAENRRVDVKVLVNDAPSEKS